MEHTVKPGLVATFDHRPPGLSGRIARHGTVPTI